MRSLMLIALVGGSSSGDDRKDPDWNLWGMLV